MKPTFSVQQPKKIFRVKDIIDHFEKLVHGSAKNVEILTQVCYNSFII